MRAGYRPTAGPHRAVPRARPGQVRRWRSKRKLPHEEMCSFPSVSLSEDLDDANSGLTGYTVDNCSIGTGIERNQDGRLLGMRGRESARIDRRGVRRVLPIVV